MNFRGYFKGLARVTRTFKLEAGNLRAEGVPAILLAVSGLVLAVGAARVLTENAGALPETLRETKGLVEAIRGDNRRLSA